MKSAAQELEELKSNYDTKREELLGKVKEEFKTAAASLAELFQAIPEDSRQAALEELASVGVLSKLELEIKSVKERSSRKAVGSVAKAPRVKTLDADFLSFLETKRRTSEIKEHFKLSAVTVSKRLKALEDKNAVRSESDGTAKIWHKL